MNYVRLLYTSNPYTHPARTTRHMSRHIVLNLNVHNELFTENTEVKGKTVLLFKVNMKSKLSVKDTARLKKKKILLEDRHMPLF